MQFQSKIQENKNISLSKNNSHIALHSKPLNADTEGAYEVFLLTGVCIKWAEFTESVRAFFGFLSPGTKQSVHNNEVSVKLGLTEQTFKYYCTQSVGWLMNWKGGVAGQQGKNGS